jgi:hypothetical protein
MIAKRPLLSVCVVVALCLVWFYFPYLSGQGTFIVGDCTEFFEPLCRFIGRSLASGHWPLWNPYAYCGMSQAAVMSPSIFFPLNWLFASMSFSQSVAVIMAVSQVVCFIGMFLLIDFLGWPFVPALIGALTVALSGYMFSLSSNYTLVATAAWLPLVLYFSLQCLRHGSAWSKLGNVLCIFMFVGGGRPEIFVPGLLMVALLAAFFPGSEGDGASRLDRHVGLCQSLVLGVLAAMPAVMPGLEWVPLSRRAHGLSTFETLMFSCNWYDYLSMFVIHPLDDFQLRGSPFLGLITGSFRMPYFDSAFVGTTVLALAAIGIFRRGRLLYWCALSLLLISGVLAAGRYVPFMGDLVQFFHNASFLRFPSKLLFFSVFCLGLFAARGARLYLQGQARLLPHMIGWLLIITGCMALFFLARQGVLVLPVAGGRFPIVDSLYAQALIGLRSAFQVGITLLTLLFMWFMQRKGREKQALNVVAGVAALALIVNALSGGRVMAGADYYEQPSFLLSRVKLPAGFDNAFRATPLTMIYFSAPAYIDSSGDRLRSTIDDFQYRRQMLHGFSSIDFRVPSQFGFEAAMVGDYNDYFLRAYAMSSQSIGVRAGMAGDDLPLYRCLQIGSSLYAATQMLEQIREGAVVAVPTLDSGYFSSVFSDKNRNVQIYELRQPLPRAYLAAGWRSIPDRDSLMDYMIDCRNNGFDPARETLVEKDLPAVAKNHGIVPVAIESPQPEVVACDVNVTQPALLVLQDQYYPGWRVEIDGARAELVRCNAFMRGVVVPPGRHHISFLYQPKSVILGLLLAFLSLIGCIALFFAARQSRLSKEAKP